MATDTTVSVNSINVRKLGFVEHHPSWYVTVVVGVSSPFGTFDLSVQVEKVASLDQAVVQAMQQVVQWGSAQLGAAARQAISEKIS